MHKLLAPILIGLTLVLWLSGTAGAQTDTVRVVYYPPWNISKLPMYLARDMGNLRTQRLENRLDGSRFQ